MSGNSTPMEHYLNTVKIYLENGRSSGWSKVTFANYESCLYKFYKFMVDYGYDEEDPSFTTLLAWKVKLKDEGKTQGTIKQYLTVLRIFFDWACDQSLPEPYYEENPVYRRIIPTHLKKAKQPYKNMLKESEIIALFRNNPKKPKKGLNQWERNYAIVILLLTTAIRNSELRYLTLADLDFWNGYMKISEGKGGKYRNVPFPKIAQEAVKIYLKTGQRPQNLPDTAPLFGTTASSIGGDTGSQAWHVGTPQWLSDVVKRHVELVTGRKGIRTHALRHASARTLLENGLTMEEIQAVLGHESVVTTEIYAEKLSPRKPNKKASAIFDEMNIQAQRLELTLMKQA